MEIFRVLCYDRRMIGRYFTRGNPFVFKAFKNWFGKIPESRVLEPFAGDGAIGRLLSEAGFFRDFVMYDIRPAGCGIAKRDCLREFPEGFSVCVTNPPWLAGNSAKRRGIRADLGGFDDLYKLCLSRMLEHCGNVAAILPESFLVSGEFTDRLFAVVSLSGRMFENTETPACLAIFNPDETGDFEIWRDNSFVCMRSGLNRLVAEKASRRWSFNVPDGRIGIRCADNTEGPSIAFTPGEEIGRANVKASSRHLTRVSGLPERVSAERFAAACNRRLSSFRKAGGDFLMAPFKGLRKDGFYRRRLSFALARRLMDAALEDIK